ncbi:MAG: flagellar biosynthesis protein FlhB [Planctomycetota bacterium]
MAEDLGEKTEEPTGRRLAEARQRGQIAKSTDFASAIVLLAAVLVTLAFFEELGRSGTRIVRYALSSLSIEGSVDGSRPVLDMGISFAEAARVMVPIMLLMLVAGFIAYASQVGLQLSTQAMQPKLDRFSPIKGAQRIFSMRSVIKATLDFGKFLMIATVVALVLSFRLDEIVALTGLTVGEGTMVIAHLALELALWCLLVLFLLGIIDLVYQRWQTNKDLRMSKQEVKDERKSTDGDPEMKGRRMQVARRLALQRIQSAVPNADVVITNPTHYAIAIRYDKETMNAPKVIAKGADFLALRIRQLAALHGVAIVERPPLARALYAGVEVGQEVQPEHFEAVAEVLAYVYRLEGRAAS